MQTFLPYEDFERSAQVLDFRRLGKQRIEAKSIIRINLELTEGNGWRNHPAVLMWKGYEALLAFYGLVISNEWRSRGYVDEQRAVFLRFLEEFGYPIGSSLLSIERPPWLGDEKFHSSHRSALLFKNPEWYSRFNWAEEPKIEYVWPVRKHHELEGSSQ